MFCKKCGAEIVEGAAFCRNCGEKVAIMAENTTEHETVQPSEDGNNVEIQIQNTENLEHNPETLIKKKNNTPVIIAVVFLLIVVVAAVVIATATSPSHRSSRQIDLGNKYLEELNYEQAVASFEAAIKIDPKNEEAYEGLVDTYIKWADQKSTDGDLNAAIELIENAANSLEGMKTSDNMEIVDKHLQRLLDRLKELRAESADLEMQGANDQLDEGEYDAALQKYLEILENDPMNVEAYLGIIEVYLRQGNYDKALEYAELGYEKTGDERLKQVIDMINSGNITDSRGLTLKTTAYDGSGNIKWWHEFSYDPQGNPTGVTSFDTSGNETSHVALGMDPVSRIYHSYYNEVETGLLGKDDYEQDELGRDIRCLSYSRDGSYVRYIVEYFYDGKNMNAYRRNYTSYSESGEVNGEGYDLYEYNSDGRPIREESHEIYNGIDSVNGLTTHTYDDAGKRIRRDWYGYDTNGEILSHSYEEYIYDDTGKPIGTRSYNNDGELVSEYLYS